MSTVTIEQSDATAAPQVKLTSRQELACRVLDMALASLLLLICSPVMLVIALAIRLDSPGPAIFRQRRVGRSLKPFTVNKFRTMVRDASPEVHRAFVLSLIDGGQPARVAGKPRFKLAADQRVTRVGRFLRRTSLDELPQLWNVVRGEMSLVGPRPALAYEVDHYPPPWLRRFDVKPGITGLWQVSGRSELTMEDMMKLDLDYVRRRTLRMNVWILLRTIPTVISLRGAS